MSDLMIKTKRSTAVTPTRKRLERMWEAAMTQINWKDKFGRRSNSCLTLYRAFHEVADKCNKREFTASNLQLVEISGLSPHTVRSARKALVEAGLISITNANEDLATRRYRLHPIKESNTTNLPYYCYTLKGNPVNRATLLRSSIHWPGDDAFTGAPSLWRVYITTAAGSDTDPLTAKDIAQIVQLHVNTVRAHLKKLRDFGLVNRQKDFTYVLGDVEACDLPVLRRTAGYTAKRIEDVKRMREKQLDDKFIEAIDLESAEIVSVSLKTFLEGNYARHRQSR